MVPYEHHHVPSQQRPVPVTSAAALQHAGYNAGGLTNTEPFNSSNSTGILTPCEYNHHESVAATALVGATAHQKNLTCNICCSISIICSDLDCHNSMRGEVCQAIETEWTAKMVGQVLTLSLARTGKMNGATALYRPPTHWYGSQSPVMTLLLCQATILLKV